MKYLSLLITLLPQIPTIVAVIHNTNASATISSKVVASSQLLGVAAQVAAGYGADGETIAQALAASEGIITATVTAIHNAAAPTTAAA